MSDIFGSTGPSLFGDLFGVSNRTTHSSFYVNPIQRCPCCGQPTQGLSPWGHNDCAGLLAAQQFSFESARNNYNPLAAQQNTWPSWESREVRKHAVVNVLEATQ